MEEEPSTLEAWREVHSTLLKACELAQESVNTQKMQYRFLLEEINANLTTDGHLTATSVWTQPKKPNLNNRRKPPTATSGKRKRKASSETAVKKTAVDLSSMDSAADNASSRGYSSDAKTPRSQQHKPKKIKISLKNSRLDSSTGKMKNLTEKSRKDAEEESAATAHHLSNVASHAVYAEEATHAVLTASGAPVQSLNEYIPSASTTSAMGDQHPSYDSHASAAVYNAAMVAPGQLVAPTLQLPLHISGTETASPVQQAALQQHPHLQQHQQHLAASLAMTAQQPQNPLQMMAAIAFGATPNRDRYGLQPPTNAHVPYSPSNAAAQARGLYTAASIDGNVAVAASGYPAYGARRSSATTTYGSIQDVVDDEEDDEDDNPF